MKSIEIYTDGACLGNPGPGGWAALLRFKGTEKELAGGEKLTTNNRMEMMAVIEGLTALKRRSTVEVFTDSQYVQKGITEWIHGWKTAGGGAVKNQDLWQRLQVACERHQIDWRWVKGHSGHPENERVDALASAAAREQRTAAA